jgi:ABC-type molybdate transport system substrate-binding protein
MSLLHLALFVLATFAMACADAAEGSAVQSPIPWQHENDTVVSHKGLTFTVPDVDDLADFHGDAVDPKLVLYVGGNYFFVMEPLVKAFSRQHPEYDGRVYWETLPPGLLIEQIKAGGTVTCGNMTWKVPADVYLAGIEGVSKAVADGLLTGPAIPYVANRLEIMVPAGNPAHIRGLEDLRKPGIRLSMPNPAFEGVAHQIQASLIKAGGQELKKAVYVTKVADGSTILTEIHHRQTPMFLMQGRADAGVVWQSEVRYQEAVGHPIGSVQIPAEQNTIGIYAGAVVKGAPHPEAANAWLTFVRSSEAMAIFGKFGFRSISAAN